jgi:hypothetical protein
VFLLLYRFVHNVLVKKLLGLYLVRRVAPYEFWKLHFENPINVQIVEYNVEYVSLGTLGVIKQVMKEFQ